MIRAAVATMAAALLAVAVLSPGHAQETVTVAIDTDPAGNATPAAFSVGSPFACFDSGVKVPAVTTVQTTVSKPVAASPTGTATIDVVVGEVSSDDRIQSYQLQVLYDGTIVNGGPPSAIATLPFINANSNSSPTNASPGYNDGTGTASVTVSDAGNSPGECGNGVLATLNFTCVAPGTSPLTLTSVILVKDGTTTNLVTAGTTLGNASITCGDGSGTDAAADTGLGDDSDGDGLSDADEQRLGSDPNNPDTDGDGVSDGQEVNVLGTDPLAPDVEGETPDGAPASSGIPDTGGAPADDAGESDAASGADGASNAEGPESAAADERAAPAKERDSGLGTGAWLAIALGSGAATIAAGLGGWYAWRRRRSS